MAQTWTSDVYDESYDAQTYLAKFEENFAALKSMFSGASAPSDPDGFQAWGDTSKKVLKYRNAGDTAWLGVFHGDSDQKIWVFRNSAPDGWTLVSGVTDKVLALKGGSTYTTGGATAGSWTSPSGLNHQHQWYKSQQPSANDKTWDSDGDEIDVPDEAAITSGNNILVFNAGTSNSLDDAYTELKTISVSTFRPAADVGTLQRLDV